LRSTDITHLHKNPESSEQDIAAPDLPASWQARRRARRDVRLRASSLLWTPPKKTSSRSNWKLVQSERLRFAEYTGKCVTELDPCRQRMRRQPHSVIKESRKMWHVKPVLESQRRISVHGSEKHTALPGRNLVGRTTKR